MDVVVVYESLFGNTREVGEAIAAGAADAGASVNVGDTSAIGPDEVRAAELVIVGAPTHIGTLSRGPTRAMGRRMHAKTVREAEAADEAEGPDADDEPGVSVPMRRWLRRLPHLTEHQLVAAFDTRMAADPDDPTSIRLTEQRNAAQTIEARLASSGAVTVATPTGFVVQEMEGPLAEGELDRARAWGGELVRSAHARTTANP